MHLMAESACLGQHAAQKQAEVLDLNLLKRPPQGSPQQQCAHCQVEAQHGYTNQGLCSMLLLQSQMEDSPHLDARDHCSLQSAAHCHNPTEEHVHGNEWELGAHRNATKLCHH